MKNVFWSFARMMIFILTLSSISVLATSPIDASGHERLRIDFFSAPDWIEISHVETPPEKLLIQLVRNDGGTIPISSFNQEGSAFPELAGVFKNKVDRKQVLFVIVKWRYYLSGVDTEGDYYEVHAYEIHKNEAGKIAFWENKTISNFYGSGFDGKQEGKMVKFRYKDVSSVRKSLIQNRGNAKKR